MASPTPTDRDKLARGSSGDAPAADGPAADAPAADGPAGRATGRPVVVYDGTCGMCRAQVRRVRRLDWLGVFDGMEYDEAILHLAEVSRGQLGDGLRVRFPDRSVTIGIDAVRSVMMRLPATAWFAWLLYVPPVRWVGHHLYSWIARRRKRDVGAACAMPVHGHGVADPSDS